MTTPISVAPPGYMVGLKTMLIEALKLTFDSEFPESDFRNLNISMEYPVEEHNFPGLWVSYEDVQDLQTAGIGHAEYGPPDVNHAVTTYKRWRFGGYVTITIVSQTSLERDRITDQLVSLIAFGEENPATLQFRSYITNNEFIGCNFDWDRIKMTGQNESPGTPWGSDDMLYERTMALSCFGEFVSSGSTNKLIALSSVQFYPLSPVDTDTTVSNQGQWL
jgi:hypothetical protein